MTIVDHIEGYRIFWVQYIKRDGNIISGYFDCNNAKEKDAHRMQLHRKKVLPRDTWWKRERVKRLLHVKLLSEIEKIKRREVFVKHQRFRPSA